MGHRREAVAHALCGTISAMSRLDRVVVYLAVAVILFVAYQYSQNGRYRPVNGNPRMVMDSHTGEVFMRPVDRDAAGR